jgi:hypothetical protein
VNPCGKNEKKGPTFSLQDLLGKGKTPPKPPCGLCDSGKKGLEEVVPPGSGSWVCPQCGRILCGTA